MLTIEELPIPGYKKVISAHDGASRLQCYIAIHNTALGPALGGLRYWAYASKEEALHDVLQLAKAMTYKSALAQIGLGGGKSVIIAPPGVQDKTPLLAAFAEVLNSLRGDYITAEDVGTSTADMAILLRHSPFVAATVSAKGSGDPSPFTAWGVLRGMQAVARSLWNNDDLRQRSVAIQGLGSVGARLADLLFWRGARLLLCDIDESKVQTLCRRYGAQRIAPEDFCATPCDILCPCALGGVLNPATIPLLRCCAVAGSANNQLSSDDDARLLKERSILYAPDYVINAGGIINAADEYSSGGYDPIRARDRTDNIYETLCQILQQSLSGSRNSVEIANALAEYNLTHGVGKRTAPLPLSAAAHSGP